MSPRLSGVVFGAGGILFCLFLIAKVDQIRRDENAYLHKWVSNMEKRLSSASWRERWRWFRATSLTWELIQTAFFSIFILAPLMVLIAGAVMFWFGLFLWLLFGGEITFIEFLRQSLES